MAGCGRHILDYFVVIDTVYCFLFRNDIKCVASKFASIIGKSDEDSRLNFDIKSFSLDKIRIIGGFCPQLVQLCYDHDSNEVEVILSPSGVTKVNDVPKYSQFILYRKLYSNARVYWKRQSLVTARSIRYIV